MKTIILILALSALVLNIKAQQKGRFTDPRDGKIYNTVTIGKQVWMDENLAFKPTSGKYYISNGNEYYYDWPTAKTVAPKGWHLPSEADFKTLFAFVKGTSSELYDKLESEYNFIIRNIGYYTFESGEVHNNIFMDGFLWSSTEKDAERAWCFSQHYEFDYGSIKLSPNYKERGLNIRCIKD
jgi:uncharacterized protein (TIGR02145 family)